MSAGMHDVRQRESSFVLKCTVNGEIYFAVKNISPSGVPSASSIEYRRKMNKYDERVEIRERRMPTVPVLERTNPRKIENVPADSPLFYFIPVSSEKVRFFLSAIFPTSSRPEASRAEEKLLIREEREKWRGFLLFSKTSKSHAESFSFFFFNLSFFFFIFFFYLSNRKLFRLCIFKHWMRLCLCAFSTMPWAPSPQTADWLKLMSVLLEAKRELCKVEGREIQVLRRSSEAKKLQCSRRTFHLVYRAYREKLQMEEREGGWLACRSERKRNSNW